MTSQGIFALYKIVCFLHQLERITCLSEFVELSTVWFKCLLACFGRYFLNAPRNHLNPASDVNDLLESWPVQQSQISYQNLHNP